MAAEGPGIPLDVLSKIVNVHWSGGGVFIAGNVDSNIYYLKLPATEPEWQDLGKLEFHQEEEGGFVTGRVAGSAYATTDIKDEDGNVISQEPVFVLVGGSGFANEIGIIMASKDGLNWTRVFSFGTTDSETYVGAGIFGIVWDDEAKMFYAGGHQADQFVDPDADLKWEQQADILFASPDGFSWHEADRHEMRVEASSTEIIEFPEYKTGLLVAHCSTHVKDGNNNGVPDGNYGKSGNLLIAPAEVSKINYLAGLYLYDIPQGSSGLVVTDLGEEVPPPAYPTDAGIPVTCTAVVGGEWMAAGGVVGNFDSGTGNSQAARLVSREDGYIWESLKPDGTNVIITMTGGMIGADAGL